MNKSSNNISNRFIIFALVPNRSVPLRVLIKPNINNNNSDNSNNNNSDNNIITVKDVKKSILSAIKEEKLGGISSNINNEKFDFDDNISNYVLLGRVFKPDNNNNNNIDNSYLSSSYSDLLFKEYNEDDANVSEIGILPGSHLILKIKKDEILYKDNIGRSNDNNNNNNNNTNSNLNSVNNTIISSDTNFNLINRSRETSDIFADSNNNNYNSNERNSNIINVNENNNSNNNVIPDVPDLLFDQYSENESIYDTNNINNSDRNGTINNPVRLVDDWDVNNVNNNINIINNNTNDINFFVSNVMANLNVMNNRLRNISNNYTNNNNSDRNANDANANNINTNNTNDNDELVNFFNNDIRPAGSDITNATDNSFNGIALPSVAITISDLIKDFEKEPYYWLILSMFFAYFYPYIALVIWISLSIRSSFQILKRQEKLKILRGFDEKNFHKNKELNSANIDNSIFADLLSSNNKENLFGSEICVNTGVYNRKRGRSDKLSFSSVMKDNDISSRSSDNNIGGKDGYYRINLAKILDNLRLLNNTKCIYRKDNKSTGVSNICNINNSNNYCGNNSSNVTNLCEENCDFYHSHHHHVSNSSENDGEYKNNINFSEINDINPMENEEKEHEKVNKNLIYCREIKIKNRKDHCDDGDNGDDNIKHSQHDNNIDGDEERVNVIKHLIDGISSSRQWSELQSVLTSSFLIDPLHSIQRYKGQIQKDININNVDNNDNNNNKERRDEEIEFRDNTETFFALDLLNSSAISSSNLNNNDDDNNNNNSNRSDHFFISNSMIRVKIGIFIGVIANFIVYFFSSSPTVNTPIY